MQKLWRKHRLQSRESQQISAKILKTRLSGTCGESAQEPTSQCVAQNRAEKVRDLGLTRTVRRHREFISSSEAGAAVCLSVSVSGGADGTSRAVLLVRIPVHCTTANTVATQRAGVRARRSSWQPKERAACRCEFASVAGGAEQPVHQSTHLLFLFTPLSHGVPP